MSGTYPATPKPIRARLRDFSPTLVSTAHSLRRQARSKAAQRWHLVLKYPVLLRAEWEAIAAFLDKQRGQYEKFTIVVPGKETPRGAVSGAPNVTGAHAKGLTTVNMSQLPLSVTVFKAGDLVKFAGHAKVYEVTDDTASDGGGLAAVPIHPGLYAALVNNEAVTYASVAMQAARTSDVNEREWRSGMVGELPDVELIEDPA